MRTKDWAVRLKLAPNVQSASRAIVVGRGTAPIVKALQLLGIQDILVTDIIPETLARTKADHGSAGRLGNELGVRTWEGDFTELPAYMGPADVVVFCSPNFGTQTSAREAMTQACMTVRPGGCVLIATDVGNDWFTPNFPPQREGLASLVAGLPCRIHSEQEGQYAYCASLQVPPSYRLRSPVLLQGEVVRGFGRGSRQMGTPTANIDPAPLQAALAGMSKGVYFGWAQLVTPEGWPQADAALHKVVLNIGSRPTVNAGGEADTVECYILHDFQGGQEFYGCHLRVVAVGYLRPELKFPDLDALVARIKADVAATQLHLDSPSIADHNATAAAILLKEASAA